MALKNIMRVDNGNVIYTGGSDGTVKKITFEGTTTSGGILETNILATGKVVVCIIVSEINVFVYPRIIPPRNDNNLIRFIVANATTGSIEASKNVSADIYYIES